LPRSNHNGEKRTRKSISSSNLLSRVPPNCQFQIDDAEQDWTFGFNSFDFIHCRDMYAGIRDFRKFIRQCFDHVKPGGWVEICSVYPIPRSDDGTLPDDAAILELSQTFRAISIRMGADSEFQLKLKDWFVEIGFEGVVEQIFKLPSSPWAKDSTMKKIGAFQLMNVVEGASGFLHRGWTKDFGQTREELELLVMRLRKELSTNKFHCYAPL
jgi:SAM-dependent methyltransferase